MEYRFQVNLGIIDLLSNHTYSSPEVYVRELLQNAGDAIVARSYLEPDFRGEINIEVSVPDNQQGPVLVFRDNGIGLTGDGIHLFLATIGETSKRDDLVAQRTDFIGHFGTASSRKAICDSPSSSVSRHAFAQEVERALPPGRRAVNELVVPGSHQSGLHFDVPKEKSRAR